MSPTVATTAAHVATTPHVAATEAAAHVAAAEAAAHVAAAEAAAHVAAAEAAAHVTTAEATEMLGPTGETSEMLGPTGETSQVLNPPRPPPDEAARVEGGNASRFWPPPRTAPVLNATGNASQVLATTDVTAPVLNATGHASQVLGSAGEAAHPARSSRVEVTQVGSPSREPSHVSHPATEGTSPVRGREASLMTHATQVLGSHVGTIQMSSRGSSEIPPQVLVQPAADMVQALVAGSQVSDVATERPARLKSAGMVQSDVAANAMVRVGVQAREPNLAMIAAVPGLATQPRGEGRAGHIVRDRCMMDPVISGIPLGRIHAHTPMRDRSRGIPPERVGIRMRRGRSHRTPPAVMGELSPAQAARPSLMLTGEDRCVGIPGTTRAGIAAGAVVPLVPRPTLGMVRGVGIQVVPLMMPGIPAVLIPSPVTSMAAVAVTTPTIAAQPVTEATQPETTQPEARAPVISRVIAQAISVIGIAAEAAQAQPGQPEAQPRASVISAVRAQAEAEARPSIVPRPVAQAVTIVRVKAAVPEREPAEEPSQEAISSVAIPSIPTVAIPTIAADSPGRPCRRGLGQVGIAVEPRLGVIEIAVVGGRGCRSSA